MQLNKNERRTINEGFDVYDLVNSAGQYAGEIHEDADSRVWVFIECLPGAPLPPSVS